jgi:hypothetical protein
MIGFKRAVCLFWTNFHLHPNGYLDHWPLSKKNFLDTTFAYTTPTPDCSAFLRRNLFFLRAFTRSLRLYFYTPLSRMTGATHDLA